jgi:hypothetical protein
VSDSGMAAAMWNHLDQLLVQGEKSEGNSQA